MIDGKTKIEKVNEDKVLEKKNILELSSFYFYFATP